MAEDSSLLADEERQMESYREAQSQQMSNLRDRLMCDEEEEESKMMKEVWVSAGRTFSEKLQSSSKGEVDETVSRNSLAPR